ncbi:neuroparsin-A-like [Rhynchophorus ferrugineus]|uniref:Neuroparsin-like protein n=1 Tax=Rhynchophorus ferrugineus TaxID=354439 RepID=A0A5Q0TWU0_RHYFE|nr:neuroparsin-like protein [Rhynchophorus ferrugineus]
MNASIVLVLMISFMLPLRYEARSYLWMPCTPCRTMEECDLEPPTPCVWGEARDECGKRICTKGPGERCGGKHNILGKCGEGMMCKSDEKCHGCSLVTLECYN